jgi:hypothetical protein
LVHSRWFDRLVSGHKQVEGSYKPNVLAILSRGLACRKTSAVLAALDYRSLQQAGELTLIGGNAQ